VLNGEVDAAKAKQSQQTALDVTADEETLRRLNRTMPFDHLHPRFGDVPEFVALGNGRVAGPCELVGVTHVVQSSTAVPDHGRKWGCGASPVTREPADGHAT